jgi:hypothetical protein
MIPNRIPEELFATTGRLAPVAPAGFLMIPVLAATCPQQSPMQCLYQQMYEQAVAITRKPAMPDLFVVMN